MKLWSKRTFSHRWKSLQNPEGPSNLSEICSNKS